MGATQRQCTNSHAWNFVSLANTNMHQWICSNFSKTVDHSLLKNTKILLTTSNHSFETQKKQIDLPCIVWAKVICLRKMNFKYIEHALGPIGNLRKNFNFGGNDFKAANWTC